MSQLMEKIAAKAPRKKKPAGGRKPRDVYAPDMSKGAPGTKPRQDLTSKAKSFKPTTPESPKQIIKPRKVYKSSPAKTPKAAPKLPSVIKRVASAPKPRMFSAKKLGLVAAGVAGAGALAAKIRASRKENK